MRQLSRRDVDNIIKQSYRGRQHLKQRNALKHLGDLEAYASCLRTIGGCILPLQIVNCHLGTDDPDASQHARYKQRRL